MVTVKRVRLRRRKGAPPQDEFLRAVKASGKRPQRTQAAKPERSAAPPKGTVPAGPPAPADGSASPRLDIELDEARRRAATAEATLAQLRDESERRLVDARVAIETEREARAEAERELEAARTEIEAKPDGPSPVQLEAEQDLERRRQELLEAERVAREERELWEEEAASETARRVEELAAAERRVAQARAQQEVPAPAPVTAAPAPRQESPAPRQDVRAPRRAAPLPPRDAGPVPPPPAPQVASAGAAAQGPFGRIRRRLGGSAAAAPLACATCARETPGSTIRDARAEGWAVGDSKRLICPQCQADGWHFPPAGSVPFRDPPERRPA